ncbi:MAG: DUF3054 domain-containing protein [Acidimicrobiia bacterium]
MSTATPTRALPRWVPPAADTAAIVAFVLLGRREHGIDDGLSGVLGTLWPFLAGWFAVALLVGTYRQPPRWNRWAITWIGGVVLALVLRIAFTGHSFVLAFAIVATVVVGAFTGGWRLVARLTHAR